MNEVALHELDERLRQLARNARAALAQGDAAYAVEVLREVFAVEPGCAEMRRTWWDALCAQRSGAVSGWMTKLKRAISGGMEPEDPLEALRVAGRRVESAPRDPTALRALAAAAKALGWSATECFAVTAWAEVEPRSKAAALAVVEVLQRRGDFEEAERVMQSCLQQYPHDGDVREAQRALGVARTMREGRWEQEGGFRGKLRES